MYINKITLMGRIGGDIKWFTTNTGIEIATISVATSKSTKKKDTNEWDQKTVWHKVNVQNKYITEMIKSRNIGKGCLVYVEGELEKRKWKDKNGIDRDDVYVFVSFNGVFKEITDRTRSEQSSGTGDSDRDRYRQKNPSQPQDDFYQQNNTTQALDDEIPF